MSIPPKRCPLCITLFTIGLAVGFVIGLSLGGVLALLLLGRPEPVAPTPVRQEQPPAFDTVKVDEIPFVVLDRYGDPRAIVTSDCVIVETVPHTVSTWELVYPFEDWTPWTSVASGTGLQLTIPEVIL